MLTRRLHVLHRWSYLSLILKPQVLAHLGFFYRSLHVTSAARAVLSLPQEYQFTSSWWLSAHQFRANSCHRVELLRTLSSTVIYIVCMNLTNLQNDLDDPRLHVSSSTFLDSTRTNWLQLAGSRLSAGRSPTSRPNEIIIYHTLCAILKR